MFGKRRIRVVLCLLGFAATLLQTSPQAFGKPGQQPLSELRERTGLAIRKRARGREDFRLSREEKILVSEISRSGEARNWTAAKSFFAEYSGTAPPVYGAALHAAFRCRKYQEGEEIYERCRSNCEVLTQPIYTAALRIFAKLGEAAKVQQIWDDALKRLESWDAILGSARIAAAADAGDVEAAAGTLDAMNASNISIEVHHINSAMRACWGWGDDQHQAAKYFFDLLPKFDLSPTVVSFTSLIGAYKTASLKQILKAYDQMKSLQIKPDAVFAETYTFCLLQSEMGLPIEENVKRVSAERRQAAREALADFKRAGLRLHKVSRDADKELARMRS
eukprot:Skav208210  [mRNA]  locus=scaffold2026:337052:338056:+ [translate_table: standard]